MKSKLHFIKRFLHFVKGSINFLQPHTPQTPQLTQFNDLKPEFSESKCRSGRKRGKTRQKPVTEQGPFRPLRGLPRGPPKKVKRGLNKMRPGLNKMRVCRNKMPQTPHNVKKWLHDEKKSAWHVKSTPPPPASYGETSRWATVWLAVAAERQQGLCLSRPGGVVGRSPDGTAYCSRGRQPPEPARLRN